MPFKTIYILISFCILSWVICNIFPLKLYDAHPSRLCHAIQYKNYPHLVSHSLESLQLREHGWSRSRCHCLFAWSDRVTNFHGGTTLGIGTSTVFNFTSNSDSDLIGTDYADNPTQDRSDPGFTRRNFHIWRDKNFRIVRKAWSGNPPTRSLGGCIGLDSDSYK